MNSREGKDSDSSDSRKSHLLIYLLINLLINKSFINLMFGLVDSFGLFIIFFFFLFPPFCFVVVNFIGTAAAASAKSLQSCPTLCDPIEGSPPGSPVPGTLQARTLEWVVISFSNA